MKKPAYSRLGMLVQPIKTRVFHENEDLGAFILEHIPQAQDGDVLVVTSKIVSLSEGRAVELRSPDDRDRYIAQEAELCVKTPYTTMTLRDGMIMSSAGVDESNANGKLILLPKDPYATARRVWEQMRQAWNIRRLGVIITDSRTQVLRRGSMGTAIAYAGFHAIKRYVGLPDIFGRILQVSIANTADPLAAAAVHTMGEGNEQQPLALIRGTLLQFTEDRITKDEIQVDIKDDVYGPLYQAVLGNKPQQMNPKYEKDVAHKQPVRTDETDSDLQK